MRALVCAALIALAACGEDGAPRGEAKSPPPPPAAPDLHGALVALGDNPTWRLEADPSGGVALTIGDAEHYAGHYAEPHLNSEQGYTMEAGAITVDLSVQPCTVGNVTYPLHAVAQPHRQAAVEGCAYMRWDAQLLALMPQIDACLAASPATRRVTYAGAYQGDTLVRLQGESAETDCRVAHGVARITPRDPNLHPIGDGEAIFVRALPGPDPGQQPGGECFQAPEVKAADGALLGWMDDPQGC